MKIQFKSDKSEVQWGVKLIDGRIVPIVNIDDEYVFRFDTPFNYETGEIYREKKDNSTDLNEQIRENGAYEVFCYDEYSIDLGLYPKITGKLIDEVISDFKKHGFNVSADALHHNYNAWRCDMKSGYRDERNGYHLFSPCGCNSLIYRATTLHDSCKNWQITYTC